MDADWRVEAFPGDVEAVRELVRGTGFFTEDESVMAGDLVAERLERGLEASGYHFLFLGPPGAPLAYACFGPVCCAPGSYDLYWIAVREGLRGQGIGRKVLAEAEKRMKALGCRKVWVETSSRDLYAPTRAFYEKCGYALEGSLRDFYAPGDHKIIYARSL